MDSDLNLSEKYEKILASEQGLAQVVALNAVDKPLLALWMILIPVFFVFYYFQFNRYKNGLRDFKKNFLITRTRVLDALYEELSGNEKSDIEKLVAVSDAPLETKDKYREWVKALFDYYRQLMQADGSSFEELVRKTYKKRSNFLLVLNNLSRSEKEFNKVLVDSMPGDKIQLSGIVKRMEESSEIYRRELVKKIFA